MQTSSEISKLQEVIDLTVEIKEHAVSEYNALKALHEATVFNVQMEREQQKDSERRHQEAVKSLSSQINYLSSEIGERLRESTAIDIVKLQDLHSTNKGLKQEIHDLQCALESNKERHEAEKYWQQEYYMSQEELVACTESMHAAMEVTNSLPTRGEASAALGKIQAFKVEKEALEAKLASKEDDIFSLRERKSVKEKEIKLELETARSDLERSKRELKMTREKMEEECPM